LLVLCLLSACARHPETLTVSPIADQPGDLRTCLAAPPGMPPPKPPRTFEAVASWAQKTEDLRAASARIAAQCRERLQQLNRWIDDTRDGR
jgi:hypothetical protein